MTLAEKRTELRRLEHEAKRLRRAIRKARPGIEKPKAPGVSQRERAKTKREKRRETRPLVAERDQGCAVRAIGGCRGNLVWDHFFGRGKVPPAVETEWFLCEAHNQRKTDNVPSRTYWLALFRLHCQSHGYSEVADRCAVLMELEAAQHPVAVRIEEEAERE